jgi:hypothetical protein
MHLFFLLIRKFENRATASEKIFKTYLIRKFEI